MEVVEVMEVVKSTQFLERLPAAVMAATAAAAGIDSFCLKVTEY